jgi:hypothetical protein
MRSGILRCRVAALRLNPRAPFPSQIRARQGYRMRALRVVAPRLDSGMITA